MLPFVLPHSLCVVFVEDHYVLSSHRVSVKVVILVLIARLSINSHRVAFTDIYCILVAS